MAQRIGSSLYEWPGLTRRLRYGLNWTTQTRWHGLLRGRFAGDNLYQHVIPVLIDSLASGDLDTTAKPIWPGTNRWPGVDK